MKHRKFANLKLAHHKTLLWLIAIVITIASAVYQRRTGPTYPLEGEISLGNTMIPFSLLRSETVDKDASINLSVADTTISGYVQFRRFKSDDDWTKQSLQRKGTKLIIHLPQQPTAGKLIYFIYLEKGQERVSLSGDKPVVLRYRGSVPDSILITHVLLVFLAMLFSNRTALEALDAKGKSYRYMLWTIGLFFIGGFILGPLMQKYAFGAYWTGIPIGTDLTDNKTLIAFLGWILAWVKNRKGKDGRGWIVFAGLLMLTIYLIPHSIFGSELDYTKLSDLP